MEVVALVLEPTVLLALQTLAPRRLTELAQLELALQAWMALQV